MSIKGKSPYEWSAYKLAQFRRTEIGFILLDYTLIPSSTAFDNLMLPGILNGRKIEKSSVEDIDTRLELKVERLLHIDALTGGEQTRVEFARKFLEYPEIIFLDEHTSALDTHTRKLNMGLLLELVGTGKTIIMVTLDLELAEKTSRNIVMRDGKIERDIELTQFNTVNI